MKKVLIIALAAFAFAACNGDDNSVDNKVPEGNNDDRYYVKYEARNNLYYLGNVSVNTEKGVQRFEVNSMSFSQTFGPVKKGFKANITVSQTSGTTVSSIYVCIGEEPFVLKQTGNASTSCYIGVSGSL